VVAAGRTDRVVQAGFCERFNVNYLEAKRAVAAGQLGSVRAVYTSRTAPYSFSDPAWELGVLDTAVHNLDLMLWLVGRTPRSVLARGARIYPDSEIPHSVFTLLTFEDGTVAADNITWLKDDAHPLHICARSRMVLHGDRGSFEIELGSRPSSFISANAFQMMDTVIIGGPEYYGCLKLQFEAWLRSIEEGAPVLAPVADALLTERVVMAAAESLRSGQEVRL
jgi:myo-inositol 2-dehydrogenase/D-chiro-inositol 1-dehydrogenase